MDNGSVKTVAGKFEEAAERYSLNPAIMDKYGEYSYKELNDLSNIAAEAIAGSGRNRAAILLPRIKEYPMAALGALKAGAAYIPLDLAYPAERIRTILEDIGQCLVVTNRQVREQMNELLLELNCETLLIEDVRARYEEALSEGKSIDNIDDSDIEKEGFIIYTSGSTGKPKGVIQSTHIFDYMEMNAWQDDYRVTADDTVGFVTGFTFIVSLCTLFLPVTIGSSVYIFDEEERLSPQQMYEVVEKYGITVMCLAPKMVDTFLRLFPDNHLKCIMCGGEKLVRIPETKAIVIENYGCSEGGSILSHRVFPGELDGSLGKASPKIEAFLLDENGRVITETDQVGELCIIGGSVAIGYNNLPEKTQQKFPLFPERDNQKMCRTGDLMSIRKDGNYEYHGRKDYMVKINGFRVELAEIEKLVSHFRGVSECCCTVVDLAGTDRICCYYAASGCDENDLTAYVKEHLAEYMIPSVWVSLPKLPRNVNGKIDRAQFPKPEIKREYAEPANEPEQKMLALAEALLNGTKFGVTDDMLSLGMDSMRCMELSVELEELGIAVTATDIMRYRNIRDILSEEKSYVWFAEKYDRQKPVLVFAQGIIFWKSAMLLCEELSKKYNILVIAPIQDYYDDMLKGKSFDDLIDIYMEMLEKKLPEPADALAGFMGISFGGQIAAGLARAFEIKTGRRYPAFLGDTLLKEKEEYLKRDLVPEELPQAALRGANAHAEDFLRRANMVNRLGMPEKYGTYEGYAVFFAANKNTDAEGKKKKTALAKKCYPNCKIIELEDKTHSALFEDPEMAGLYFREISEASAQR